MAGWLGGWMDMRLAGCVWLAGWLAGWLADSLSGWLTGWLARRLVDRCTDENQNTLCENDLKKIKILLFTINLHLFQITSQQVFQAAPQSHRR